MSEPTAQDITPEEREQMDKTFKVLYDKALAWIDQQTKDSVLVVGETNADPICYQPESKQETWRDRPPLL